MFGIGGPEIVLIIVLGVLLFGANLPRIGRSVGKTVNEFKHGLKGIEDDIETAGSARPALAAPDTNRPPQRVVQSTTAVGV